MAARIKGKCKFCGKELSLSYMNKHLPICEKRKERLLAEAGSKSCGYYELCIVPKYNRDYWLFIEIRETATLRDLDAFLRDIWLECCGHLSAFEINGIRYESVPDEDSFWGPPAKSMNCKLNTLLKKGMTIDYEYDYGSTTSLTITVVNYWPNRKAKDKLVILSRNNPHPYICSQCGKNHAVVICMECVMEGDYENAFLCEDCMKTHACDSDLFLDVCNSPRMGVCGYCGSEYYPDQFEPDCE